MSLPLPLQVAGARPQLLDEVLRINDRQKEVLFRKLLAHNYGTENCVGAAVTRSGACLQSLNRPVIINSPALKLIEALWAQGVKVMLPRSAGAARAGLDWAVEREDLICIRDPYEAAEARGCAMLVTEWKAY